MFGLTLALLTAPLAAEAQPATKVPRIGYLATDLAGNPFLQEAFRQGFRELGLTIPPSVLGRAGEIIQQGIHRGVVDPKCYM